MARAYESSVPRSRPAPQRRARSNVTSSETWHERHAAMATSKACLAHAGPTDSLGDHTRTSSNQQTRACTAVRYASPTTRHRHRCHGLPAHHPLDLRVCPTVKQQGQRFRVAGPERMHHGRAIVLPRRNRKPRAQTKQEASECGGRLARHRSTPHAHSPPAARMFVLGRRHPTSVASQGPDSQTSSLASRLAPRSSSILATSVRPLSQARTRGVPPCVTRQARPPGLRAL